jgi:hypothetical protein
VSKAQVKPLAFDDDLLTKSNELTIGSKSTTTPRRAFYFQPDNDGSESRIINKKKLRGINEIYLSRNFEDLTSLRGAIDKQTRLTAAFQNALNNSGIGENEIIFTFFQYDARRQNQRNQFLDKEYHKKKSERKKNPDYVKYRAPTRDEIDYIVRLYSSIPSDLVTPPLLYGTNGTAYAKVLDTFFELIADSPRLKSRPVMGIIPKLADFDLPQILDIYLKHDVRLYAFDFKGGHPLNFIPHLERLAVMFRQIEKDYNESCYLHGLNVRFGRMMANLMVPARDILSFGVGLDSFGASHLGGGQEEDDFDGSPELKAELRLKMAKNRANLFNRSDYGYHKLDGNPDIDRIFKTDDKDTIYDLKSIHDAETLTEVRHRLRIFNAERQGKEASHLIEDIVGKMSMKDYIERKNSVDDKTKKELSKLGQSNAGSRR